MRRPLARRWLLAACCLAAAACLPRQPRPPPDEGAWATAREGATRQGKLYDGLSMNAFASAVYLSLPVREARVERVSAWNAYTREERDRVLAQERDEASRYEDFLVSLFTPDRAANDLDAARSVWRLSLVVPGDSEWLPASVHGVRADPMMRELYPTIGHFDATYLVRFPRREPLERRRFTFRMAGPKGRIDFEY